MPHVVGFAKNSSLRNRAALARACASMCRHVLRASVESHPITPGEREGGVQEKNTHTNVRRFSLQKQQKIEGWNQQQRRKQESQNQHVWKEDRYPHQKLPSASKCSSEHKTRVEPDPQFCCCTHEQTYLWTLAIKLFHKSRDKLEKRSAESQEPTKTADCRKWETVTGNGVQKKQQMKPSPSSTSSTKVEVPLTLDWFRCDTPPKYEEYLVFTLVMFTTSLGLHTRNSWWPVTTYFWPFLRHFFKASLQQSFQHSWDSIETLILQPL